VALSTAARTFSLGRRRRGAPLWQEASATTLAFNNGFNTRFNDAFINAFNDGFDENDRTTDAAEAEPVLSVDGAGQ
jgi:hypothetical protein